MNYIPIIAIVVAVLALWKLLPSVALIAASRLIRPAFKGGPDALTALGDSQAPEKVRCILALGFQPLGIKTERLLWTTTQELAFTNPDKHTFASIARLTDPLVYYYSVFTDGLLLTANTGFRPVNAEGVTVIVEPVEVEALYRVHAAALQQRLAAGSTPTPDYSAQGRLMATTAYYSALPIKRQLRTVGLSVAVVLMAVLSVSISIAMNSSRERPRAPNPALQRTRFARR